LIETLVNDLKRSARDDVEVESAGLERAMGRVSNAKRDAEAARKPELRFALRLGRVVGAKNRKQPRFEELVNAYVNFLDASARHGRALEVDYSAFFAGLGVETPKGVAYMADVYRPDLVGVPQDLVRSVSLYRREGMEAERLETHERQRSPETKSERSRSRTPERTPERRPRERSRSPKPERAFGSPGLPGPRGLKGLKGLPSPDIQPLPSFEAKKARLKRDQKAPLKTTSFQDWKRLSRNLGPIEQMGIMVELIEDARDAIVSGIKLGGAGKGDVLTGRPGEGERIASDSYAEAMELTDMYRKIAEPLVQGKSEVLGAADARRVKILNRRFAQDVKDVSALRAISGVPGAEMSRAHRSEMYEALADAGTQRVRYKKQGKKVELGNRELPKSALVGLKRFVEKKKGSGGVREYSEAEVQDAGRRAEELRKRDIETDSLIAAVEPLVEPESEEEEQLSPLKPAPEKPKKPKKVKKPKKPLDAKALERTRAYEEKLFPPATKVESKEEETPSSPKGDADADRTESDEEAPVDQGDRTESDEEAPVDKGDKTESDEEAPVEAESEEEVPTVPPEPKAPTVAGIERRVLRKAGRWDKRKAGRSAKRGAREVVAVPDSPERVERKRVAGIPDSPERVEVPDSPERVERKRVVGVPDSPERAERRARRKAERAEKDAALMPPPPSRSADEMKKRASKREAMPPDEDDPPVAPPSVPADEGNPDLDIGSKPVGIPVVAERVPGPEIAGAREVIEIRDSPEKPTGEDMTESETSWWTEYNKLKKPEQRSKVAVATFNEAIDGLEDALVEKDESKARERLWVVNWLAKEARTSTKLAKSQSTMDLYKTVRTRMKQLLELYGLQPGDARMVEGRRDRMFERLAANARSEQKGELDDPLPPPVSKGLPRPRSPERPKTPERPEKPKPKDVPTLNIPTSPDRPKRPASPASPASPEQQSQEEYMKDFLEKRLPWKEPASKDVDEDLDDLFGPRRPEEKNALQTFGLGQDEAVRGGVPKAADAPDIPELFGPRSDKPEKSEKRERPESLEAEFKELEPLVTELLKRAETLRRRAKPGDAQGRGPAPPFYDADGWEDFYDKWKWMHNYQNNSVVRDFFNRFMHCGAGPVPKGKFPGDARSCMQQGTHVARLRDRKPR
jgi:hypothetical protein